MVCLGLHCQGDEAMVHAADPMGVCMAACRWCSMGSKGGVLLSAPPHPAPCCRLRAQSSDPKVAKRAHGASRDANRTVSSSVDAGDVIQLKPIVFSAPAALHGSPTCGAAHAASACRAVTWIAHMRCSPCGQHMQHSAGAQRVRGWARTAEHLSQEAGRAGVCGEVRKEAGRLPVRNACRQHEPGSSSSAAV